MEGERKGDTCWKGKAIWGRKKRRGREGEKRISIRKGSEKEGNYKGKRNMKKKEEKRKKEERR